MGQVVNGTAVSMPVSLMFLRLKMLLM